MTREEAIKVLAILKAAYPNSYRNMTKDEASGTVAVWSMQFANIPADVVMIAINKLISTSPFPPAISEVKKKIGGLYWESWEMLKANQVYGTLSEEKKALYERIFAVAEAFRNMQHIEPSLKEITEGVNGQLLIGSNSDQQ